MKFSRVLGAAAAGVALSATVAAPANAGVLTTMDFAVFGGEVQMVVFGSGYHVSSIDNDKNMGTACKNW